MRPVSASWLAWYDSARFRRRSFVTSWNTMTAPIMRPCRSQMGAADSWIAISWPGARDQHGVIGRCAGTRARRAQRAQQRILRAARASAPSTRFSTSAIGAPARLVHAPAGEALGHRIHVFDATLRASVLITASPIDCSVTSRALLLLEHRLLGALALGDVVDRAFVADERPAASRIAREFSRITSCWPSRRRARNSTLRISPSRVHAADELARGRPDSSTAAPRSAARTPLRRCDSRTSRRTPGSPTAARPSRLALVHAFGDALEQAAELRFAAAQSLLGEAPLDGDARELRGVRHESATRTRRRQPGLRRDTRRARRAPCRSRP